jgi:hypothetical protein
MFEIGSHNLGEYVEHLCFLHNCGNDDSRYQRLLQFYLGHFYEFTREVLGYDDLREQPHREICDFVGRARGDGRNRSSNVAGMQLSGAKRDSTKVLCRRLGVFVPRDSFKTTIVGVSYPIWRWCQNPRLKVLLASAVIGKSREILQEIESHMEDNVVLKHLFGNMALAKTDGAKAWSRDQMQLYDPATRQFVPFRNMYSALAVGMEGSYTGKHPNLVIADDLVTRKNVSSPDQLQKPKDFLKDIEPTMGAGSELIVSGTRYDFSDAYQGILDRGNYDVIYRSAVDEFGKLWFPDRLNWDYLRSKETEMGPYDYSCQYLMVPINPKDCNFKDEWISQAKYRAGTLDITRLRVVVVVDPAAGTAMGGQKKVLDNTAIVVMGMDGLGVVWVLNAVERKIGPLEMAEELVDIHRAWKPEALCVESVGFQTYIEPIVQQRARELEEQINYHRVKQTTRDSKNHRLLARLVPMLSAGKLKIVDSAIGLFGELSRFDGSKTTNKDNLLDAVEMGIRYLQPPDIKEKLTDWDVQKIIADKKKRDDIWDTSKEDSGVEFDLNDIFLGEVCL